MAYQTFNPKDSLPHHIQHVRRTSPTRRAWKRGVPRAAKLVLCALVAVLFFGPVWVKLQSWCDNSLRTLPTIFPGAHKAVPAPSEPVRQQKGGRIDDQYLFMKELGSGMEGRAAVYSDLASGDQVVVKIYTQDARDPLPEELEASFSNVTSTWPSEIEVETHLSSLLPANDSGYVHMLDYFILKDTDSKADSAASDSWSWAMVTPFMSSGTLVKLASSLNNDSPTPGKIDKTFRPAFNNMLASLALLHKAGMCHDDIKPDNVFIGKEQEHWLLGDLGNVRHMDHPWHSTRTWRNRYQWANCQLNDVRRALKTYLSFIRDASPDQEAFDTAFYAEEEPWSRLYWQFMRWPATVNPLLEISKILEPDNEASEPTPSEGSQGQEDLHLSLAVTRELTCTTLPPGILTWWKLGGWWREHKLETPPAWPVERVV